MLFKKNPFNLIGLENFVFMLSSDNLKILSQRVQSLNFSVTKELNITLTNNEKTKRFQ